MRVVITGIGIWSCIGTNIDEVKDSLYNGKSGIIFDPSRIEFGYQSGLVGNVPNADITDLNRKLRRTFTQEAEYAYAATKQALQMSGIDPEICGCIFSNDGSNPKVAVEVYEKLNRRRNSELLGPNYIFQGMNSNVSMNLCTVFGFKGISYTISAACAGGNHAVGSAYLLIKNGLQKAIVCGGAQDTLKESSITFDALDTFSKRNDDPIHACRPFDTQRDGLIPSGGSGALILEEYEHAINRGATILGEIIGYGFSSNGLLNISQPSIEGSLESIESALYSANLTPNDIDYINAHATSTPQGDLCEGIAINKLFYNTPISSTKSMTGHECWTSGANEIIYSLIMMHNDFIAPNINLISVDKELDELNIIKETTKKELNIVLSNSFGFGGTNSTIIIKKYD